MIIIIYINNVYASTSLFNLWEVFNFKTADAIMYNADLFLFSADRISKAQLRS
jgi:hypothetical protein